MDIKNTDFDADFDSIEKAAKNIMGKKISTKKWKKMFLTFITVCISFQPITFLGWLLHFFQQIWTQHRILRFMVPKSKKYLEKYFFDIIITFC